MKHVVITGANRGIGLELALQWPRAALVINQDKIR